MAAIHITRRQIEIEFCIGDKLSRKICADLPVTGYVGGRYRLYNRRSAKKAVERYTKQVNTPPKGHYSLTKMTKLVDCGYTSFFKIAKEPDFPAPAGQYLAPPNYRTANYYCLESVKQYLAERKIKQRIKTKPVIQKQIVNKPVYQPKSDDEHSNDKWDIPAAGHVPPFSIELHHIFAGL